MTERDVLFDDTPYKVSPPASIDSTLSPDRRRTLRQREAITRGVHPLNGQPLHPNAAPEITAPGAPTRQPYTCGSCRFRQLLEYHNRSWPKCLRDVTYGHHDAETETLEDVAYVSHGAATDVRAWWPACHWYEAGDTDLSPDAARHIGDPS